MDVHFRRLTYNSSTKSNYDHIANIKGNMDYLWHSIENCSNMYLFVFVIQLLLLFFTFWASLMAGILNNGNHKHSMPVIH